MKNDILVHPCFDNGINCRKQFIHLPVAAADNVRYKINVKGSTLCCHQDSGTIQAISPEAALDRVKKAVSENTGIKVVGISGPGDALADQATLKTFKLIDKEFPQLGKCLNTNGLLLLDLLNILKDVNIDAISVNMNALRPWVGAQIYESLDYHGELQRGETAARTLLFNQLNGIEKAIRRGLKVKVHSVLIPGVNEKDLEDLEAILKGFGLKDFQVTPANTYCTLNGPDATSLAAGVVI